MNELEAARERLRAINAQEQDPIDVYDLRNPPPNHRGKWGRWEMREALEHGQQDDCETLADAYLAEHPADDGELITEEWLRSVGFKQSAEGTMMRLASGEPLSHLRHTAVSFDLVSGNWFANGLRCRKQETRGHLRRLCAALGIPITEPEASGK